MGFSLHAGAQRSTPSIEIGFEEALVLATRWIVEDHAAEAKQLLDGLGKAYPDHPQVPFLNGQFALIDADDGEAVKLFRRRIEPGCKAKKKAVGLIVDAQVRYVLGEDNRNFLRTAIGSRDYSGACADCESLESTAGGSLYSERPAKMNWCKLTWM